jgi:acyl-ACP thioesterase
MLNLPPKRRRERVWQKEFFQKHGLDFESTNLRVNQQNTLDMQALRRLPVRPLDVNLLRELVKPSYVEWINRNVVNHLTGLRDKVLATLLHVRKVGGALRRLGFTDNAGRQLRAYNAYLVLLPIEKLLRRRNQR